MWKEAIHVVQDSDETWIRENRREFSSFFSSENKTERGGLKNSALEAHYRNGLFKMFLGKEYGGLALPVAKGAKWIENATALDSSWGWLLAIGVGGAYFADYLSPEIAQQYFSPAEALVAGSGKPDGEAEAEVGNFGVSGSWSYCSGCEQASLFTAVTLKEGKPVAFVLPVEKAQIIRDWNTIGLRLTGSHSISADNAQIPADHFFNLMEEPRPSDYPISSYPFLLFAAACFVPVIIGISRSFWAEVDIFVAEKAELWEKFQPKRYAEIGQRSEDFQQRLYSLKSDFYELLGRSWQNHLRGEEVLEKALTAKGLEIAEFCYTSAANIIPDLGMPVLSFGHPVQKLWQDLQTAYQHMVFHPF